MKWPMKFNEEANHIVSEKKKLAILAISENRNKAPAVAVLTRILNHGYLFREK